MCAASHFDLPCVLAGGLGGSIRPGNHIKYPDNTPMSNLLVALLDKIGLPIEKMGGALAKGDDFTVSGARRTGPGQVEVHDRD